MIFHLFTLIQFAWKYFCYILYDNYLSIDPNEKMF